MEHWVQRYSALLTEEALNAIKCLTVLEELDSNSTLKQLNTALAFARQRTWK